jgi:phage-related protein
MHDHKMRARKHLQQWNVAVQVKFEERKRLLKAFLGRHQIYEQQYVIQWMNSL